MSLWGTAHAAANNKPKFLTTDEDSDYTKQDCYATQGGWSMRAGTKATGNGNTSADPEILVAIGDLAGSTDTTGLRAPTVTNMRFIWGTAATTDGSAGDGTQRILVEITWDEAVTVAGSPQIVVDNGNQSGGGYGDHTLTYTATGSTANRKRFVATSRGLGNTDVLTIGGTNLALNSGTISDTVRGGTSQAASLVLSGLTAVTHTVTF
jgi:hypothetical protein|tara:strand:- start:892 stop:1515 length:624 start_codon:yes stop_codon:yes gene_type:complete